MLGEAAIVDVGAGKGEKRIKSLGRFEKLRNPGSGGEKQQTMRSGNREEEREKGQGASTS